MASICEAGPEKTQVTNDEQCVLIGTEVHGKLNIKRCGRKRRCSQGSVDIEELDEMEVEPEVMASVDSTSLQMGINLDQEKATTAAVMKPTKEVTQHLDAVESSNDGSQLVRDDLVLNIERSEVQHAIIVDDTEVLAQTTSMERFKTTQDKSKETGSTLVVVEQESVLGIKDTDVKIIKDDAETSNDTFLKVKRRHGRSLRKPVEKEDKEEEHTVSREEILKLLPQDESQEFSSASYTKLKELFRGPKPIHCPKEGCRKSYNTLVSFKFHVTKCGINLSFPCSECGKIYKSGNGLAYHRQHTCLHQSQVQCWKECLTGLNMKRHEGVRTEVPEEVAKGGKDEELNEDETVVELGEMEVQPEVKRKRGRPRNKPEPPPVPREEILKLLPEGSYEFSSESYTKLKKLFRGVHKPIGCPREGCAKSYISLVSFKYHVERCGGIDLSFPCSDCGKIYKSRRGLLYHRERTCDEPEIQVSEKMDNSSEDEDEELNKDEDEKLNKDETMVEDVDEQEEFNVLRRKKTRRSFYGFTDGKEEVIETPAPTSDPQPNAPETRSKISSNWMKYIEAFESRESIDTSSKVWEKQMADILKKLDQNKIVKCPKKCGLDLKERDELHKHLDVCLTPETRKYRCHFCKGRIFRTKGGIKIHMKAKHRKLKQGDNECSSEYSEGELEDASSKPIPKISRLIVKNKDDYEKITKSWYQAIHSKLVFATWTPTVKHWSKLPESEVQAYLPVRKMSPRFTIQPAESETTQNYPEFELPMFSSVPVNAKNITYIVRKFAENYMKDIQADGGLCNLTFNVGGPVWAMDWAAVPVDEKMCSQYLAVGCHRDADEVHLISGSYQEKGVLQIWRVANLENGKRPQKTVEFCLGVAYDYGPLWDIRWCPSGAWERVSTKAGHLRRLGLVALACADGKVRVLSVPFPEVLFERTSDVNKAKPETLIFRAIPHAELSPGSTCKEYNGECGPVWSTCWLPGDGHKKILASYGDGTIAIWDLTSQNPLLRVVSKSSSEKFFPISHFQAHYMAIRASTWCPSDFNYIATTSYDRTTKIWDLRHTSQPITSLKRGFNYQLTWPLHWPALMFSCDTAVIRRMLHGSRSIDLTTDNTHMEHSTLSLTIHSCATWDTDYCNWSNILVSVDASGEVKLDILGNLNKGNKGKQKLSMFSVTYEGIPPTANTVPDPVRSSDRNTSEAPQDGSTQRHSYKLIFSDTNPLFDCREESVTLKTYRPQAIPLDEPTYAALHKVRWNPNISSYYWLATAGRAGIVRICHVDAIRS